MTEVLINLFIFASGTIVGSFLNVLIDRIPKRKDFVFTRSECDFCGQTLSALDMFPIFSYMILGGRCRYCKKRISVQNPLVEAGCGLMFVYSYQNFVAHEFYYQLVVTSILISIFVIDLKERIIPDSLVIFLLLTTLIYHIFFMRSAIFTDLLTGTVFLLFFLFLAIITRGRGMGMGDVKFAFFMGFYLGPARLVPAFYLAFLTGAIISLILVFSGRKKFKSTIPFGPFLVFSTFLAYKYGYIILELYQKSFF